MNRRWYCSLETLKSELGVAGSGHDAKLGRYIERASAWIEQYCRGRVFVPVTEARRLDYAGATRLPLDKDLLAVTTLTNGDGELLIEGTDFLLYPLSGPPYRWLEIRTDAGSLFQAGATNQRAIAVAGRWGYREEREDTGLALAAGVNAAATTLAVGGLEVGWSILIDDEQLFVSDTAVSSATVQRGNNGTTAAVHDALAAIWRYRPEPAVEQACILLAGAWHGGRKDAGVQQVRIGDYAATYVQGVPQAVKELLEGLRRRSYAT